jgi:purine nucleoside phosphorylase
MLPREVALRRGFAEVDRLVWILKRVGLKHLMPHGAAGALKREEKTEPPIVVLRLLLLDDGHADNPPAE